uniref:Uncharacterized protein n=1 Tax=Opuntia streptacantha TaxID=393608 RepID=A0A7C9EJ93_OPUST
MLLALLFPPTVFSPLRNMESVHLFPRMEMEFPKELLISHPLGRALEREISSHRRSFLGSQKLKDHSHMKTVIMEEKTWGDPSQQPLSHQSRKGKTKEGLPMS